jgi:general secretion pathway protein H
MKKHGRGARAIAGFTLVEIMIVAFIIGLVAAMAVITFGGSRRDTELDKEAERLDALLDYAREQAELQTRDFGFRTIRDRYQFVVFNVITNEWRLVEEDDALRERALPEGLLPTLVIEGRPVVLDTRWPKIDDFKPQVMIFGNGDLTSFEWALTREGTNDVARVRTDEQSAIRLQLPGEATATTALERAAPPRP